MATYSPSKITKDGNTYNFTDDTKIPLAGTNALAGSIVPSTNNAYDLGDSTYGFKDIYTNKMYLKGSTIFNVVDDNYICLGGATAQANGANLVLNGKNRSTSTGEFKLEARDGTNVRQLIGKPDGTLSWNGNILPSADGVYDLGSPSYNFRSISAKLLTSNDDLNLYSSYSGSVVGSFLTLKKIDSTSSSGSFQLNAHTETKIRQLIGYPDGTLSWSGTSIIPASDDTCELGSSSYNFKYVNARRVRQNNLSDTLFLIGAPSWDEGASISLFGKNNTTLGGGFRIDAHNGTDFKRLEGTASGTLSWSGSPITYTSDYRLKDEINSISDDILDAWENLEPKQYKYKSDLENDKENAQVHYGWIAQDVESIIKGDRKGEVKNGLWLHEEWEEQKEISHEEIYTEEVQTKDGSAETVTKTRKVIDQPYREKGDSYGLRYTECLVVECAYLRKCIKELRTEIEQLKSSK